MSAGRACATSSRTRSCRSHPLRPGRRPCRERLDLLGRRGVGRPRERARLAGKVRAARAPSSRATRSRARRRSGESPSSGAGGQRRTPRRAGFAAAASADRPRRRAGPPQAACERDGRTCAPERTTSSDESRAERRRRGRRRTRSEVASARQRISSTSVSATRLATSSNGQSNDSNALPGRSLNRYAETPAREVADAAGLGRVASLLEADEAVRVPDPRQIAELLAAHPRWPERLVGPEVRAAGDASESNLACVHETSLCIDGIAERCAVGLSDVVTATSCLGAVRRGLSLPGEPELAEAEGPRHERGDRGDGDTAALLTGRASRRLRARPTR